ncbi:MAG: asparagine synthase (glutamine-hydrolyzing) [Candidatus Sungbacteria bacterium]|uniref:asparagine synthase (glutamine-hydrolyzing) n=1 Tax=Candidatus Sungiibacteriota bacterium TaxID=2750080 RepID=A0A932QYL3_9BACT|nr:asparagine synthase (glutamine-hydrolyzing) [Candidatus Sungbacteria bacterium]
MCGIAGIAAIRGRATTDEIGRITRIVAHRGPDDHGYLGYNSSTRMACFNKDEAELQRGSERGYDVLFGHRRLSILDLSESGRCPMSYDGGRLWITYNGEVYNYIELREELKGLGYRFTTGTDTEVILAAYRAWGMECLHRFNGMWAFALLDVEKSILFCARDRLGVKPFYYHWDGSLFSFGSEIKQLLALDRVSKEMHAGVLFDFLTFDTYGCNSEQTFYRDVLDMRGGHYLIVPLKNNDGWAPRPVQWWDIDLRRKEAGRTDRQYADRYLELFEDSVRLRLRSDVPLGTCLSGGLDSSGIVCIVDRLLHKAGVEGLQKTFTAVSDNPAFDEREYAQAVIDATRVDPSFVLPTPGRLLQDLERLLWHQDEPFLSTSIFAGWCVYGLAREKGVKVTLDGQGPDEMLGGYYTFMYAALLAENAANLCVGTALRNAQGVHDTLGFSYPRIARDFLREVGKGLLPVSMMSSLRKARTLFQPAFFDRGVRESVFLKERAELSEWRRKAGGSRFDRLLYRFTKHDSLPGILRQVDRNSMAFSIEARLPFLDYRLVEYTFSLPNEQKLLGGVAKQVYRRALSGIIPDKIRDRTHKLGFVTAESEWLRQDAKNVFMETFNKISTSAPYNRKPVQERFNQFLNGQAGFDTMMWKVFCTERWFAIDAQRGA